MVKRWRLAGTSKIAPHQLDASAEPGEALLQIFNMFSHGDSSNYSLPSNAWS